MSLQWAFMRSTAALTMSLCIVPPMCGESEPDCGQLTDEKKVAIVKFVERKHAGAVTSGSLQLISAERISGSCFELLRFRSSTPTSRREFSFYLSPDHQFLARELLDVSIDPLEQERRQGDLLKNSLAMGSLPALGPPIAPSTIVIFSDFQCPFCRHAAAVVTKEVLPKAGDRARLVFRHLPLPQHSWARTAAEGAACAFQQGNDYFWSYHDLLFSRQQDIDGDHISEILQDHGRTLKGFDLLRFSSCMESGMGRRLVDADTALATAIGVSGVPAMFVNGKQTSWQIDQVLDAVLNNSLSAPDSDRACRQ